jgi:hypothetical protein
MHIGLKLYCFNKAINLDAYLINKTMLKCQKVSERDKYNSLGAVSDSERNPTNEQKKKQSDAERLRTQAAMLIPFGTRHFLISFNLCKENGRF